MDLNKIRKPLFTTRIVSEGNEIWHRKKKNPGSISSQDSDFTTICQCVSSEQNSTVEQGGQICCCGCCCCLHLLLLLLGESTSMWHCCEILRRSRQVLKLEPATSVCTMRLQIPTPLVSSQRKPLEPHTRRTSIPPARHEHSLYTHPPLLL